MNMYVTLSRLQGISEKPTIPKTLVFGLDHARLFFLCLVPRHLCRGNTPKQEQLLIYLQDMGYHERDVSLAVVCVQCQLI